MQDLIERLEKATGPDSWLNFEIQQAVEGWKNLGGGYREWSDGRRERYNYTSPSPPYTASIDTALTLVPEGPWNGTIMWDFGQLAVGGFVELNKANPAWLEPGYQWDQPPHAHDVCVSSYEDTESRPKLTKPRPLAIAICIAALKARQASPDRSGET